MRRAAASCGPVERTFPVFRVIQPLRIAFVAALLAGVAGITEAGDRQGVTQALQDAAPNWPDAQFSVDITGLTSDGAMVDQPINIEFEAAQRGYVSYLRVSSHGDMTLSRTAKGSASSVGSDPYMIAAPLGTEQLIVFFSDRPLDPLFSAGANVTDLGSDRQDAESFVRRLDELKASGLRIAKRRYQYMVGTPAGGTEYTTRGIVFQVEHGDPGPRSEGHSARIPSRVEFEFDSDRLTDRGKRDLDEFGEALATRLAGRGLVLEGHTDAVGTDEYNLELSRRRADAVRRYLVESFGLNGAQIIAQGKGKADPVASNDTETARSRNRRVDFVFSSPGDVGK